MNPKAAKLALVVCVTALAVLLAVAALGRHTGSSQATGTSGRTSAPGGSSQNADGPTRSHVGEKETTPVFRTLRKGPAK